MSSNPPDQQLRVSADDASHTLDDMRRAQQRNLLSSPNHPQHDQFSQVRVCLDKQEMARSYSPGERDNLAAALALEAARGRHGVDHVVFSHDGARAFAVEGELDSPSRQVSYVDAGQAAQQSIQRSSEQFAQLAREQELQDRQRELERQRDAERRREREQQDPDGQAAARSTEREQPSLLRNLFKDKD
ncbi:XVIPCD domain-containing protein [Lysobacter sp. TAB13]|uniref:XVIPCD domain-containing protein n=1 Tax=Lysobacter sp. TAB13 TaxID=3233065 RepID=UPI003F986A07